MSLNISVRVKEIQQITPVIREFSFEAVNQQLLPFSSGSHIVVQLPLPDRVLCNAYSLLNDPYDQHEYKIAVRLQEQSRGGSRYLHEQVKVGDQLKHFSPPQSVFDSLSGPASCLYCRRHWYYSIHVTYAFYVACR